jgi:hypothetical protein
VGQVGDAVSASIAKCQQVREETRHIGRPKGCVVSDAHRANIAAGVRRAYAEGRVTRKRWQPPDEFAAMYYDLQSKFGPVEAHRLIEDHARVVARRRSRGG